MESTRDRDGNATLLFHLDLSDVSVSSYDPATEDSAFVTVNQPETGVNILTASPAPTVKSSYSVLVPVTVA